MKKFWSLAAAATLALTLAACGEEKETTTSTEKAETAETPFPVTVTDAVGNKVTLEEAPERIVSLVPSNTEILFGLGFDEEIVGVNDSDNYPAAAAEKAKIGGIEYNLEVIASLAPDIVFAHESALSADAVYKQLQDIGVNVFVVDDATTFEETYDTMEAIGTLTGRQEQAEQMIEEIETDLAEITEKVKDQEPRTAFVVVGAAPDIYLVGQNTFMNEMLKAIEVENLVTEEGWPMYSAEDFVAANPDSIIFTYGEDVETIKNNVAFSEMTAIQQNTLKLVDGDTTSRQGPRLAEGVASMAEAIYPEVFND